MSCVKQEGAQPAKAGKNGLDFNPFEAMEPRMPGKTPAAFKNGAPVKSRDITPDGVYQPD